MREQARDIWAWLENGAEFFVCGDKERMAADVDRELHTIAETDWRPDAGPGEGVRRRAQEDEAVQEGRLLSWPDR